MHHLHTLEWLIDKLTEGDCVLWIFFIGTVILLVIAFIHDLQANKRKNASALNRDTIRELNY